MPSRFRPGNYSLLAINHPLPFDALSADESIQGLIHLDCEGKVRDEASLFVHHPDRNGVVAGDPEFPGTVGIVRPLDFLPGLNGGLKYGSVLLSHIIGASIDSKENSRSFIIYSGSIREVDKAANGTEGRLFVGLQDLILHQFADIDEIPRTAIDQFPIRCFVLILELFFSEIVVDDDGHGVHRGDTWMVR